MRKTVEFEVVSHADMVLEELNSKVETALSAIGATAQGYAMDDAPVDTGRLKNSIDYSVVDDSVYIGTNVEYAPYVELLDRYHTTGKAHFLRDAAANHSSEYKEITEAILKE